MKNVIRFSFKTNLIIFSPSLYSAHPFLTQASLLQQANGNTLGTTLAAVQSPGLSNQQQQVGAGAPGGQTSVQQGHLTTSANNVSANSVFANLNSLNAAANSSANSINSQQAPNSHSNSNQQLLIPIMQNLNDDVSKRFPIT